MIGGAIDALGLGDMLSQQVRDETDEQRKKRMAEMQQRSLMGSAGSLATSMLFGRGAGTGAGMGGPGGMRGYGA